MKNLAIILIAAAALVSSCKKSRTATSFSSTGVIKGSSPFMRSCGGNYWIVIDDTLGGCTFDSLPAGSGIDLSTTTFPINVTLNWHYQTPEACSIVVIDAIEKVD